MSRPDIEKALKSAVQRACMEPEAVSVDLGGEQNAGIISEYEK